MKRIIKELLKMQPDDEKAFRMIQKVKRACNKTNQQKVLGTRIDKLKKSVC